MVMIDVAAYRASGVARLPAAFSNAEIAQMNAQIDRYVATERYGVVTEADSAAVRAVHGLHLSDPFFAALCADPRLTDAVTAILGEAIYVHQFKINMKAAHHGQSWPWHQDYIFWERLDGIARPDLVNVAICLSDITPASGPVVYLHGSHLLGNLCIKTDSAAMSDAQRAPQHISQRAPQREPWQSDVGHDLTYQLPPGELESRLAHLPKDADTGAAGDVTLFHPQLVHGSGRNVSPHDRRLLLITYNRLDNRPTSADAGARPDFLCSRDFTPVALARHLDQTAEA